jgi:serine phosphatase RsbU (regulator of sigma subunit)
MVIPVLAITAVLCLAAAVSWARSARLRHRVWRALDASDADDGAISLAWGIYRKDLHAATFYGIAGVSIGALAATDPPSGAIILGLLAIPAVISLAMWRTFVSEARLAQARIGMERRAVEVLDQEQRAPRMWAERLAPESLPDLVGFEVGRVYQPGSGMMAGDFYDFFRLTPTRVAAVIGDVAGHGIEASITAFQAKYLLRVFLRQFKDPAQAVEELNSQMYALGREEEFISLVVVVFDTRAGTLRYTSAGHPAAYLWHDRELQPLRATGPLLMLAPASEYFSREIGLDADDLCLLYTDGLAEARDGEHLFGEERIAAAVRRDPGVAADVLCKSLLEAARDFANGPINDDVAIMAIRRE